VATGKKKKKKKGEKLSLCLTNQALRHEDVWGSGCIDPRTKVNEWSAIKNKSKNGWKRNKTRYERKKKERRQVMKRENKVGINNK
jgi:hypothetical protein